MTPSPLSRRLATLEATRAITPISYTPEEREAATRRYAEMLEQPPPADPRRAAYFASVTLKQAAADWDATVRGAPAPWL